MLTTCTAWTKRLVLVWFRFSPVSNLIPMVYLKIFSIIKQDDQKCDIKLEKPQMYIKTFHFNAHFAIWLCAHFANWSCCCKVDQSLCAWVSRSNTQINVVVVAAKNAEASLLAHDLHTVNPCLHLRRSL
jgi:hypothetical protein